MPPSSSSPTNTSSSSNNNTTVVPLKTQHCPALPGTAIVAGFFPGFIAGILLALLTPRCLGWCRRRRIEHENARDPDLTSMTTISGKVSNPIYQPQYGCRTDFLRQNSISRSAAVSNRVKSLFSRSPSTVTRGVYGRDRGLERGGDTPTTISTAASTCNSSTASLEPPAQSQMQHAQHPLTPTLPPNQYSKAGVVLTPARTTSTKSASKMTPTSIKQNKDRNTALTRSSSTESISVVFSPPRPLRPTPNRSDTSTPPSQPENPFLQPSAVIHSPPRPSKGPPRATNTPPPRTTATITRVPPPIPPPIPPRRLAVPVAVPTYQTLQQQHHSQHLQPQTYRESPTQQSQRDRDSHMTSGTTFTAMMQDAGLRGDDIFFTPSPPLPNSAVTAKGEGPRPLSLGAGYSNRAKIEGGGLRIKDV
ncbi:MAG: hypothetical protein M1819_006326 [Sarea resinae]|nr:MAG: hypothetical protein M1819_006326 [Sarea resinae]